MGSEITVVKKMPPALAGGFPSKPLALNDLRSDEKDQLLGLGFDLCMLKQVAQQRYITQERDLVNGKVVSGLNNAANNQGRAVANQYVGGRLLCIQCGVGARNESDLRSCILH